jgi:transposase
MARPPLSARAPIDPAEERTGRRLASARHAPASLIQRARIITASWDGASVAELAPSLGCHPKTVSTWLHRFNADGLDGLADLPRPGLPRRISEHERGRIIQLAPAQPETPAPWTLDALAQAAQAEGIRVGRSQVRRILQAERVRWRRTRSWATSTDADFAPTGTGHRRLHHPARGDDGELRRRARPGHPRSFPPRPPGPRTATGSRHHGTTAADRRSPPVDGAVRVTDGRTVT